MVRRKIGHLDQQPTQLLVTGKENRLRRSNRQTSLSILPRDLPTECITDDDHLLFQLIYEGEGRGNL